jgi:hypothetical protein
MRILLIPILLAVAVVMATALLATPPGAPGAVTITGSARR